MKDIFPEFQHTAHASGAEECRMAVTPEQPCACCMNDQHALFSLCSLTGDAQVGRWRGGEIHRIAFLISGKMRVERDGAPAIEMNAGEMLFIPKGSSGRIDILQECRILVDSCKKRPFKELPEIPEPTAPVIPMPYRLPIRSLLNTFVGIMCSLLLYDEACAQIQALKHDELAILFNMLYSQEELINFFF